MFEGKCKQAESIRETCSRDPAKFNLDILTLDKLIFSKKKQNMRENKQEKKGKTVAICTGES